MKKRDVELLSPARKLTRTTSLVVWRSGLEVRCRVSPEGTGNMRRLRPRNNPSWLRERLEASLPRRALSRSQPLPPDSPRASKVLCTPSCCHCPSTYLVLPSIVVPVPSRAGTACSPRLPSRAFGSRMRNVPERSLLDPHRPILPFDGDNKSRRMRVTTRNGFNGVRTGDSRCTTLLFFDVSLIRIVFCHFIANGVPWTWRRSNGRRLAFS